MTKLAFVDTETTGLDPDLHQIWEVGLIVREEDGTEREHRWFLPVDLGRADPFALKIGHFHERYGKWIERTIIENGVERVIPAREYQVSALRRFSAQFAKHTRGAHLVGAVVSFDEERLRRLLKANGACPEWHYHLITVEALAVGWLQAEAKRVRFEYELRQLGCQFTEGFEKVLGCLGAEFRLGAAGPPWNSDELTRAVGVALPSDEDRHTALGDARWAMRLYDAVMGTRS